MKKQNPFKFVGKPPHEFPTHLKEKVMRDVTTAKSLMEMSDTFTNKYKEALASLFRTYRKKKEV